MRRVRSPERPDWQAKVEGQGLTYAVDRAESGLEIPYWHEAHRYEFSEGEIDYLEGITEMLHEMAMTAVERMVTDPGVIARHGLHEGAGDLLARSFADAGELSMYGRFDLAWGGQGHGHAKLLEYNADTPTGLVEASVCQWMWLEDLHPDRDQWNLLHELLLRFFTGLRAKGVQQVHFGAGQEEPTEDWATVAYLRDVAAEAGLTDLGMSMEEIGWDSERRKFVDLHEVEISHCYKLFPTDWMLTSEFAPQIISGEARTRWIEPPWKLLAGSKALLAVLWEMYPGHPNLLPTYFDDPRGMEAYAVKPFYGWEGDGVRIVHPDGGEIAPTILTGGQDVVYQEYVELPDLAGARPVLGTWVIDGAAAGLGIREADTRITTTQARFVPHLMTTPRSTPDQVETWLGQI